ncbi:hypothetical protein KDA_47430 [Dictyobacter alpinus]|uniref:Uncharacterized protein n=1 Tax=Dictyobacter alpinus TaxID=2014873 RepID=A0A402BD28_9CHLR|nr:hypothetical protein KDA_47430 [Dictyobacter alpinus]
MWGYFKGLAFGDVFNNEGVFYTCPSGRRGVEQDACACKRCCRYIFHIPTKIR